LFRRKKSVHGRLKLVPHTAGGVLKLFTNIACGLLCVVDKGGHGDDQRSNRNVMQM
jgi:hypothetical protein